MAAAVQEVFRFGQLGVMKFLFLSIKKPQHTLWLESSPGGIRTCDQSINSRPLYR